MKPIEKYHAYVKPIEKYHAFEPRTRTKYQIKSQSKLTRPRHEIRKIRHENEI
jgi:hypothetical protein